MRPMSEAEAQELGERRQEALRDSEPCRLACCVQLPVQRVGGAR